MLAILQLFSVIKIPKETEIPSSTYRGHYVGHKMDVQVKIKFSEHAYNYYSIFPISRKRSLAKFKSARIEAAAQHLEIIK